MGVAAVGMRPVGGSELSAAQINQIVPRQTRNELNAMRDRPGLIYLAFHVIVMGGTGYLLHLSLGTWWVIPAILAHGYVIAALFSPFHETAHFSAFKSRWLNESVFWLTGIATFYMKTVFRIEHMAHHAHTQDIEKDPQRIPMAETFWGYVYYSTGIPSLQLKLWRLINHPLGRISDREKTYVPEDRISELQRDTWVYWAVYALVFAVSLYFQTWAAVIYWIIPALLGEPFQRMLRIAEHTGCELDPDMLRNTRTTRANTFLRWLNWNMAFHVEHHAISSVPFYALPRLHEVLAPHLVHLSKGYLGAQRDIIRFTSDGIRTPASAA